MSGVYLILLLILTSSWNDCLVNWTQNLKIDFPWTVEWCFARVGVYSTGVGTWNGAALKRFLIVKKEKERFSMKNILSFAFPLQLQSNYRVSCMFWIIFREYPIKHESGFSVMLVYLILDYHAFVLCLQ